MEARRSGWTLPLTLWDPEAGYQKLFERITLVGKAFKVSAHEEKGWFQRSAGSHQIRVLSGGGTMGAGKFNDESGGPGPLLDVNKTIS